MYGNISHGTFKVSILDTFFGEENNTKTLNYELVHWELWHMIQ